MNRYEGCKCFACGKVFMSGDDVVVCPDCGTPYHRQCYTEQEGCTNTALHESGGAWQPFQEQSAAGENNEPKRCARCGQENPPEGLFCNRCGMPLNDPYNEPRPFNGTGPYGGQIPYGAPTTDRYGRNTQYGQYGQPGMPPYGVPTMKFDQDSDIDGVKLGDYARYVGKNQFSFLTSFIRFAKFGSKASINFPALIFPQFYFFYRKMPLLGALYMLLSLTLSVPAYFLLSANGVLPSVSIVDKINFEGANFQMILNVTSTLLMAVRCIAAVFANYWYYRSAKRNIIRIRENASADDETVGGRIAARGGVSLPAFLLSMLLSYALTVLLFFVLNMLKL